MNKSKLIMKLTILATLGVLIFSFTPVVQGAQTERIRPIDDWIYGNDPDSWDPMDKWLLHNWWKGDDWDKYLTVTGNPGGAWRGWVDYNTKLVIHFDWIALNDEIEYDGFVLEQVMADGSLKISVNLHVKDIYIEVYNLDPDWDGVQPPSAWNFIVDLAVCGTMDFKFEFVFILNKEIPGGKIPWTDFYIQPGIRNPGAELPTMIAIWYYPHIFGVQELSMKFSGMGTGNFVESGWLPPTVKNNPQGYFGQKDQPEFWWFLPPETEIPEDLLPVSTGETAKVKVDQMELIKPQFKPDHPNLYGWPYFWPPCEKLEIF